MMRIAACVSALFVLTASAWAGEGMSLIDFSAPGAAKRCEPQSTQVRLQPSEDGPGLDVRIEAGDYGYPGVFIRPAKGMWNLSKYGHVEARITNTGEQKFQISLRVDNPGDWKKGPWNTEATSIKPGETKDLKVIFGYQYGMKKGYPLDPGKVKQLLIFTFKAKKDRSFRIESIRAAGPAGEEPPVDPKDVRIKPEDGYLLGGKVKVESPDKQIKAGDGATARLIPHDGQQKLHITCPAEGDKHTVEFRPPIGRWDLTMACEVRARVTNVGGAAVTPGLRVASGRWNRTGTTYAEAPLKPGETREIVRSFAADTPWRGKSKVTKIHDRGVKGTGTTFLSDRAEAVHLVLKHDGEAEVRVDAIRATAEPARMPDWLGRRPPVDGDWKLTFDEDFDGSKIDMTRWQVYGPNWWGGHKLTHWTKDNLILGGGKVRMRMSVDPGWHNDDPDSGHRSELAGGFLETYGKWVQRYGYFECRFKLPEAPGLWPAFWMMPDRGPEAGPQWKRADTGNGGMELDIMEHLTRWGPYRYNLAVHWDGYGKNHMATGSPCVYTPHDEEGYITAGMLWVPGKVVWYANGREVARLENDRVSTVRSNIMLTMPIGGWDNNAIDRDQLPADWIIDYVRAWQRDDLASDADGTIGGPDALRSDQQPDDG